MWEILIGVRHVGCPISDVSNKYPGIHIQNLARTSTPGDGVAKRLLKLQSDNGDAVDQFVSQFDDHPRADIIEVFGNTGQFAYVTATIDYESSNPSVSELIDIHHCYQRSQVPVSDGLEHWMIYTQEMNDVGALIDDIESYGNEINKYRTNEIRGEQDIVSLESSTLLSKLTARQQSVLEQALQLGYYRSDENVTLEHIAAEMDIHQTTAWEHLKKAENILLTELGRRMFSTGESASTAPELQ